MLQKLFGERQIYRNQQELDEIPIQDKLLNYDEAITLALLRRKASAPAEASGELQKALYNFGLQANFFEATKPENMDKVVLAHYKAKIDSYRFFKIEEKDRLKGVLSRQKTLIDKEIKRIMQSIGK